MTIKSIPEPFLVQWRKTEKNSDRFQPINVNAEEFQGSSCLFPHSVLVIKQRKQLENFTFQIKIKNFVGTRKMTIQGIWSIFYIYTQGNADRKVTLVPYFKKILKYRQMTLLKTKQNRNLILYSLTANLFSIKGRWWLTINLVVEKWILAEHDAYR